MVARKVKGSNDSATDLSEIEDIVDLMSKNDLLEVEVEKEGVKIRVKRESKRNPPVSIAAPQMALPNGVAAPTTVMVETENAGVQAGEDEILIRAPLVGTFYTQSDPDTPQFVEVGSHVEPDTVVCIIEAMKVMNEIKAECRGVVREVLTENTTPVEFNHPLFRIETEPEGSASDPGA